MFRLAIPVLHVENINAAEKFYCDQLGFEKEFVYRADETLSDPCYMGLKRDSARLHIHSFFGVAGVSVFLTVDDVDALHAEFLSKRVAISLEPTDQTWGTREMGVKDADGNTIVFANETRA